MRTAKLKLIVVFIVGAWFVAVGSVFAGPVYISGVPDWDQPVLAQRVRARLGHGGHGVCRRRQRIL